MNLNLIIDKVTIAETGKKPKYRVTRGDAGEVISKFLKEFSKYPDVEILKVVNRYHKKT